MWTLLIAIIGCIFSVYFIIQAFSNVIKYKKSGDYNYFKSSLPIFLVHLILGLGLTIMTYILAKHTPIPVSFIKAIESHGSLLGAILSGAITLFVMLYNTNELTKRYDKQYQSSYLPFLDLSMIHKGTSNKQTTLYSKNFDSMLSDYKKNKQSKYVSITEEVTVSIENLTDKPAIQIVLIEKNNSKNKKYLSSIKPFASFSKNIRVPIEFKYDYKNKIFVCRPIELKLLYSSINGVYYNQRAVIEPLIQENDNVEYDYKVKLEVAHVGSPYEQKYKSDNMTIHMLVDESNNNRL